MDNETLEKINEIRSQADIVDVISRHINVIRKGKNYSAICPFHNDTNPSLSISQDKQIFKCFVCNEAGNVFTFIQKYKKIPFMNAVKEVADIVGVDFKLHDAKPVEINNKQKVLYDIIKDTVNFYRNSLASNEKASEYCANRQLTFSLLNEFQIGYSPDFDKLIQYLLAKGYKKDDIFKSGVAIENDGVLKDRFAHRLIFPITDLNGNVVAFSGRIIEASDMAKYVNSPETELFTKGSTLYHYANAINSIKKEKKVYVCEGFMDCIALCRAGITNSIALMGTAFTKEHLKLFKYLGVEVVLCLDGDNPGNINANKLANELEKIDVNVSVIPNYNDVKDLDEFYVKYGGIELVKHLNSVVMSAFDFNFYVASKLDELKNNENKKKFLRAMCKKISTMEKEDIDLYSNKLHEELGFSSSTINSLISQYQKEETRPTIVAIDNYKKMNKIQDLQLRVLTQMLDSTEAIDIFISELVYLEDESYRKIALIIGDFYKENKENFSMDKMVADLFTKVSTEFADDEELNKTLAMIDGSKDKYPSYSKESFSDLMFELKEIAPLEAKLEQIKEESKFVTSPQETKDYTHELMGLKQLIKEKRAKHKEEMKNG